MSGGDDGERPDGERAGARAVRRVGRRRVVSAPPRTDPSTGSGTVAQTADDTDGGERGWGRSSDEPVHDHDAWLQEQRPPHWG